MTPILGYGFEWHPARVQLVTAYAVDDEQRPRAPLLALVGADTGAAYRLEERERQVYDALADLDPEQLAVNAEPLVGFAAAWGFLGKNREHYSLAPDKWEPVDSGIAPGCVGQRVAGWIFAIRELREARELWRAWAENDRAALRKRVEIRERAEVLKRAGERIGERKRTGERVAGYLGAPAHRLTDRSDPIALALWSQPFHVPHPRGDLRAAAFALLLAMIERRTGAASIGFEPDARAPFGASIVARPRTLLEAAWIQMAGHVLGGDTVRRCAACPRVFTVERTTGPPREYCGDACKKRIWRQRKAARRPGRKRNSETKRS